MPYDSGPHHTRCHRTGPNDAGPYIIGANNAGPYNSWPNAEGPLERAFVRPEEAAHVGPHGQTLRAPPARGFTDQQAERPARQARPDWRHYWELPYWVRHFGVALMRSQRLAPNGQVHQGRRAIEHPARRSFTSRYRRFVPVVLAMLAVFIFGVLTDGGQKARQTAPLHMYISLLLERVGLGLSEVSVTGQRMTSDSAIYARLNLAQQRSIWLLDTEAARRRVETLPWVAQASVKRVFPDRLHISIVERTPRAVWSDGRKTVLIDAKGNTLGPVPDAGPPPGLPVVFGPGAPEHADAMLKTIARIPALKGRVRVLEWVARRRWTLHLAGGQRVLLPEKGQSLALRLLTKGPHGQRLIDTGFQRLDLRVPAQAAIAFSDL